MWRYFVVGFYITVLLKYNDSYPCDCGKKNKKNKINEDNVSKTKRGFDSNESVTEVPKTRLYLINKTTLYLLNTTVNNEVDRTVPNKNILNNKSLLKLMGIHEVTGAYNNTFEKICPNYIKDYYFELNKMADVWKIMYHQMPEKLGCFKLLIRLLSDQDKKKYSEIYGDFNKTINWNKCVMEITSDVRMEITRKHILQSVEMGLGIMENFIIEEEQFKNYSTITLSRETADEWFIIKNIMVMRDCDTGQIAVFTRFPYEPKREDIRDILTAFGDEDAKGKLACSNDTENALDWLKGL